MENLETFYNLLNELNPEAIDSLDEDKIHQMLYFIVEKPLEKD